MTLVLDAGASIALDCSERPMSGRLKAPRAAGELPRTHGGVLAQVWRDVARLAQALAGLDAQPLDQPGGRVTGEVLAATGSPTSSMPRLSCLAQLARSAGRHVELVRP